MTAVLRRYGFFPSDYVSPDEYRMMRKIQFEILETLREKNFKIDPPIEKLQKICTPEVAIQKREIIPRCVYISL